MYHRVLTLKSLSFACTVFMRVVQFVQQSTVVSIRDSYLLVFWKHAVFPLRYELSLYAQRRVL
jgi:hypothetical protein